MPDNLASPAQQLRRFTTTPASKERIIEALRRCLQLEVIKFQPSLSQLAAELRDYRLLDTNCVQDSVIALAIALEHAEEAKAFKAGGRIGGVYLIGEPAGTPMNLPGSRFPWRAR